MKFNFNKNLTHWERSGKGTDRQIKEVTQGTWSLLYLATGLALLTSLNALVSFRFPKGSKLGKLMRLKHRFVLLQLVYKRWCHLINEHLLSCLLIIIDLTGVFFARKTMNSTRQKEQKDHMLWQACKVRK